MPGKSPTLQRSYSVSKAAIAKEAEYHKKVSSSIYGFWQDRDQRIQLKVLPMGSYTRVKMIDVKDYKVFEELTTWCQLAEFPKRTKWKGFDFITHLQHNGPNCFENGLVHLPKAMQETRATLTAINYQDIRITFFCIKLQDTMMTTSIKGEWQLTKLIP